VSPWISLSFTSTSYSPAGSKADPPWCSVLPSTWALSTSLGDSAGGEATSSAHEVFPLLSSVAGAPVGVSVFFGGCEMRSASDPEGLGSEPKVDISRSVNVDDSLFLGSFCNRQVCQVFEVGWR
jgi:hypothetical protein